MDTVKILHCSDIHLGSDFHALGRKAITRRADLKNTFLNIIRICKSEEINILLAVGDIFESWNIPEENFTLVRDAFKEIPDTKIIIAAGNHDPLTYNSPYLRENYWSENVHILPSSYSSIVFDEFKTEVWGASFSSTYSETSLIGSTAPQNPDYIQLGAVHGMLGPEGQTTPYNPISSAHIARTDLDYLALGHIHMFSGIKKENNTFYAYPGCPEGRGFDELGEKGVILGEVGKNYENLLFYPTSRKLYLETSVDISGCSGSRDASKMVETALSNQFGTNYEDNLYKVYLEGEIYSDINLNLDSIKGYLDRLFYVKLRDRTSFDIDLEVVATEMSLRGIFVRKMLEKIEADDSEELKESLKLGLKAFSGEVHYSED